MMEMITATLRKTLIIFQHNEREIQKSSGILANVTLFTISEGREGAHDKVRRPLTAGPARPAGSSKGRCPWDSRRCLRCVLRGAAPLGQLQVFEVCPPRGGALGTVEGV